MSMSNPVVLYGGVGLLIGVLATKMLIEPARIDDFLIGAAFGFIIGGALAISRRMFWR